MGLYRFADWVLASTVSLEELPGVAGEGAASPDLSVHLVSLGPPDTPGTNPAHNWCEGSGWVTLSLYRAGRGFRLLVPQLAEFAIDDGGHGVTAWAAPGLNLETLRHLLLDQVLPRVLAHRGRLVLHAGAVRIGADRAIAFVGETGAGKSTLTASFHAAGSPLLSDDALVLCPEDGAVLAVPTYPSLRLWPESVAGVFAKSPRLARMAHYSDKQRVAVTDGVVRSGQPASLAALYVLAPAPENGSVELNRLPPRDACMAIVENAFQLDVTDTGRAARALAQAAAVAERVPAFRLAYPQDFGILPAVRAAILGQHGRPPDLGAKPDRAATGALP